MDIWSKLESDSNRYWFIGNDAFSSVFRLFRSLLIFEIIHRISCCFRTFDMESMAQFQWFHQDHFLESLIQSWRFKFEARLAPDGGQVIIPKRTNQLRTNPVNFLVRFSSTVWRNLWMLFPTSSYNFFFGTDPVLMWFKRKCVDTSFFFYLSFSNAFIQIWIGTGLQKRRGNYSKWNRKKEKKNTIIQKPLEQFDSVSQSRTPSSTYVRSCQMLRQHAT